MSPSYDCGGRNAIKNLEDAVEITPSKRLTTYSLTSKKVT